MENLSDKITEIFYYDIYLDKEVALWSVCFKKDNQCLQIKEPIPEGISRRDFDGRFRKPAVVYLKSIVTEKGMDYSDLSTLSVPLGVKSSHDHWLGKDYQPSDHPKEKRDEN